MISYEQAIDILESVGTLPRLAVSLDQASEPLKPGHIYNSDGPYLINALKATLSLLRKNFQKLWNTPMFAFPFRLANTTFVTKVVKQRLEDRRHLSLMALQASFNCIELHIPISDSSAFTNLNSLDEWERFYPV